METKAMTIEELKELLTESKNGEGVKLECIELEYLNNLRGVTVYGIIGGDIMIVKDFNGCINNRDIRCLAHYASHKKPKFTQLFEYVDSHFNNKGFMTIDLMYPVGDLKKFSHYSKNVTGCQPTGRSIWIDEDFNIVEKIEDN